MEQTFQKNESTANEPQRPAGAEGASPQPVSVSQVVKGWVGLQRQVGGLVAVPAGVTLLCALAFFAFQNIFVGSVLVALAVVFGAVALMALRLLGKISTEYHAELELPMKRLLQTVTCLSEQSLELLPEERRSSFTHECQQKLLKVARGVLEHQMFIDQVVDNMFEMMFLLNADGVILKANKSACLMTGYDATELIGQHIRRIFPQTQTLVDYYLELEIQFTTQGEVRDLELQVQTSEGEVLPFSINGVKIESSSGELIGYTLIAKNLSDVFKLINQLNRTNFELNQANSELEKRYDFIKNEIEEKEGQRKILEMELNTSKLVQRTFLPQASPEHPFIGAAGTALPAAFCGGDWWNTIALDNKFYIFIGDVTGHGTASAMVTAAVSGYFVSIKEKLEAGEQLATDEILMGFHSVLATMANGQVSYNMTFFACCIDLKRSELRYANAGHNFPVMVDRTGKMSSLVARGNRLGGLEKPCYEEKVTRITGGEFIFFYTDGLIENSNNTREAYGKKRLRHYIESHNLKNPKEFVSGLLHDSLNFFGAGRSLEDDITFVAVRVSDELVGFDCEEEAEKNASAA